MVGILIAGVPAGGKSSFAAVLAQKMALPLFSKDDFKELLFDSVGFRSRAEKQALGKGSFNILCACAETEMRAGRSFILENNFEETSRPAVERLFSQYRCPALTVLFTGDPSAVYARFLARDQSPSRHRGHVVNTVYPEPPGEKTAPSWPDEQTFWASVQARGMDRFAYGQLLRVDCTDFSKVDFTALAVRVEELAAETEKAGWRPEIFFQNITKSSLQSHLNII